MLGLGTCGLRAQNVRTSLNWALNDIGYTLIDCAQAYHIEEPLGKLLKRNDYKNNDFIRDDLYITS